MLNATKWKLSNLNSDQISAAAPSRKKFLDARTKDVAVSKCCCLTFQPSGPMFLKQTWHLVTISIILSRLCKNMYIVMKLNLLKWVLIKVSYSGLQCTPSESLFPCFRKILTSKPPHLIWKHLYHQMNISPKSKKIWTINGKILISDCYLDNKLVLRCIKYFQSKFHKSLYILRSNITLCFDKTKSNESTTLFKKFKELRTNANEQMVVSIMHQCFVSSPMTARSSTFPRSCIN
jgi:hypothetical protein